LYNNTISPSLLNRAQSFSQTTLHPTPKNQSLGLNQIAGTINYSIEFDNRPTALISGSRAETVSVNYEWPSQSFAEIFVLDRAAGPILQDLGSQTSKKVNVSIDSLQGAATQSFTPTKPDGNSIASGYLPSATYVFKSRDTESWSPTTGRYNKQVSWTWTN